MRSALWILTASVGMLAGQADAAIFTFYEETFDLPNNTGINGPAPPPNTAPIGTTTLDVTGTTLVESNDFAKTLHQTMLFRDLTGTAMLTSQVINVAIGAIPPSFLEASLDAILQVAGNAPGDSLTLDAVVNGTSSDLSTTVNASGLLTLDLSGDSNLNLNSVNTIQLRVTATQDSDSTFIIDNLQLQGVPEPASMSLLGMGVAAMCGAGYRRRRKQTEVVG